jgi:hypothetical protein
LRTRSDRGGYGAAIAMREEEARLTYSIRQIEGIGPAMAAKLASIKIRTTAGLLEAASTAKGRKKIAD